jgi:predicted nucleic acid-binding protein
MIILDTNVISEFTRPLVSERVEAWLAEQDALELATTTVTEAELLVGIAMLPNGRRKTDLERETASFLYHLASRILPFDRDAAQLLPLVALQRRAARLATDQADGQIAAIARLHGAAVATRNVTDFEHSGIRLINPWTARP